MKTRAAAAICLATLMGACLVELPDPVKELNLQVNNLDITSNGVSISASANSSDKVREFGVEYGYEAEYWNSANSSGGTKVKSTSFTLFDSTMRVSLGENSTTLYVCAYAVVGNSVIYSPQKALDLTSYLPVVAALSNTATTYNRLAMSATVSNNRDVPVTERGFCWSTSSKPTINSSKVAVGKGVGTFSDTIKGLSQSTSYYVRAYATNWVGTSYYGTTYYTTASADEYLPVFTSMTNPSKTYNTLTMSANVSNDKGLPVTERGFCWNEYSSYSSYPTILDSKIAVGKGTGNFSATITGLSQNTNYYVRAYATNEAGTSYYGTTYTTSSAANYLPVFSALTNTSITYNSLAMSANVSEDKGQAVTERGFCWSTSINPTISNSKMAVGSGLGTFSYTITGLSPSTYYYVRAYATNAAGTSYYGSSYYYTGAAADYLPVISSLTNPSATYNSLVMSAIVFDDKGVPVIERGFCWSATVSAPTISNSKIAVGKGVGVFSDTIKGLFSSTSYYVRAYATNAAGTSYYGSTSYATTNGLPVITELSNTSKTYNRLVMSATVSTDNGLPVTERGFCWNTGGYPTISDSKKVVGSGTGAFSDTINGLSSSTNYYVRAYATNAAGTSYYGTTYYTTDNVSNYYPVISSQSNTSKTYNTLVMSANVYDDKGIPVTERGFCWSTSSNPLPTINNSKIAVGKGTGAFSDTIKGLSSGTQYYVRAYATNAAGTSYYGSTYYTTTDGLPVITELSNPSETPFTLVMSATISDDQGLPVTERGFCWNTGGNPTISNNKIAVGSGIGTFSDTIKGLYSNTRYYVRAYATNAIGTSYYGSGYCTTADGLPAITGLSNPSKTHSTLVMSATVSDDKGIPVTERGFCWNTSPTSAPTFYDSKIIVGSGTGTFSDTIKGLNSSTNYYVRAYATNAAGTSYSVGNHYTTNAVPVTGVTLNKTAITLTTGADEVLTATVEPSNAGNKNVTWASSNNSVARVNIPGRVSGYVYAEATGTATITVTTQDGGKTDTCTVTVNPAVTGVTLSNAFAEVGVSRTLTLTPTVQPTNAPNKNVTWASSNTAVATVSSSGVVTGVAVGTATITVTTVDGGRTASCEMTIVPVAVTGVTLSQTSASLTAGATRTLTATIAPADATNKAVTWTSSNTAVATVNSSGLVVAVSMGMSTITATTQDGSKTATCLVVTDGWITTNFGTASFATNQTWIVLGSQTWSDVVQTSTCSGKTTFNGNNSDCRFNPDYKGDLFSWHAVNTYKTQLCPSGWRVPTRQDYIDLDKALGGTGNNGQNNPTIRDRYLNNWGGAYGGRCDASGSMESQGTSAFYWSQSWDGSVYGYNMGFNTNGDLVPQGSYYAYAGMSLRCVR